MNNLEYRLNDEEKGFPVLYYYLSIPKEELSLRLICDYFIKDQMTYEKDSVSFEEDNLFIIYVTTVQEETQQTLPTSNPQTNTLAYINLEIREFIEGELSYPVIKTSKFLNLTDLLNYTLANYLTINGFLWEKTSLEVDEDRKVYILYVCKND